MSAIPTGSVKYLVENYHYPLKGDVFFEDDKPFRFLFSLNVEGKLKMKYVKYISEMIKNCKDNGSKELSDTVFGVKENNMFYRIRIIKQNNVEKFFFIDKGKVTSCKKRILFNLPSNIVMIDPWCIECSIYENVPMYSSYLKHYFKEKMKKDFLLHFIRILVLSDNFMFVKVTLEDKDLTDIIKQKLKGKSYTCSSDVSESFTTEDDSSPFDDIVVTHKSLHHIEDDDKLCVQSELEIISDDKINIRLPSNLVNSLPVSDTLSDLNNAKEKDDLETLDHNQFNSEYKDNIVKSVVKIMDVQSTNFDDSVDSTKFAEIDQVGDLDNKDSLIIENLRFDGGNFIFDDRLNDCLSCNFGELTIKNMQDDVSSGKDGVDLKNLLLNINEKEDLTNGDSRVHLTLSNSDIFDVSKTIPLVKEVYSTLSYKNINNSENVFKLNSQFGIDGSSITDNIIKFDNKNIESVTSNLGNDDSHDTDGEKDSTNDIFSQQECNNLEGDFTKSLNYTDEEQIEFTKKDNEIENIKKESNEKPCRSVSTGFHVDSITSRIEVSEPKYGIKEVIESTEDMSENSILEDKHSSSNKIITEDFENSSSYHENDIQVKDFMEDTNSCAYTENEKTMDDNLCNFEEQVGCFNDHFSISNDELSGTTDNFNSAEQINPETNKSGGLNVDNEVSVAHSQEGPNSRVEAGNIDADFRINQIVRNSSQKSYDEHINTSLNTDKSDYKMPELSTDFKDQEVDLKLSFINGEQDETIEKFEDTSFGNDKIIVQENSKRRSNNKNDEKYLKHRNITGHRNYSRVHDFSSKSNYGHTKFKVSNQGECSFAIRHKNFSEGNKNPEILSCISGQLIKERVNDVKFDSKMRRKNQYYNENFQHDSAMMNDKRTEERNYYREFVIEETPRVKQFDKNKSHKERYENGGRKYRDYNFKGDRYAKGMKSPMPGRDKKWERQPDDISVYNQQNLKESTSLVDNPAENKPKIYPIDEKKIKSEEQLFNPDATTTEKKVRFSRLLVGNTTSVKSVSITDDTLKKDMYDSNYRSNSKEQGENDLKNLHRIDDQNKNCLNSGYDKNNDYLNMKATIASLILHDSDESLFKTDANLRRVTYAREFNKELAVETLLSCANKKEVFILQLKECCMDFAMLYNILIINNDILPEITIGSLILLCYTHNKVANISIVRVITNSNSDTRSDVQQCECMNLLGFEVICILKAIKGSFFGIRQPNEIKYFPMLSSKKLEDFIIKFG